MWTFIFIYILHYYYLWSDVKISLWTYYYILSVISLILFGKYRNRTKFTDTEFSRYQFFLETDRYWFLRNPIYLSTEEPNRYLPNARPAAQGTPGVSGFVRRARCQCPSVAATRRQPGRLWVTNLLIYPCKLNNHGNKKNRIRFINLTNYATGLMKSSPFHPVQFDP